VTLVVDVTGKVTPPAGGAAVQVVNGRRFPPPEGVGQRRVLGVASLEPGTAWLDLRRLGPETLLVVRAGKASATWLHTVARQLADVDILVAGIVVVHPDPRDRSDGTLWSALNIALRGRAGALVQRTVAAPVPAATGLPAAVVPPATRPRPGAAPRPAPRPVSPTPAAVTASAPTVLLPAPRAAVNAAPTIEDTVPIRAVVPAKKKEESAPAAEPAQVVEPAPQAEPVGDAGSVADTVRVPAVAKVTSSAPAAVDAAPEQPAGAPKTDHAERAAAEERAPVEEAAGAEDAGEATTEPVPDQTDDTAAPDEVAAVGVTGERPASTEEPVVEEPASAGGAAEQTGRTEDVPAEEVPVEDVPVAAARAEDDDPNPGEAPRAVEDTRPAPEAVPVDDGTAPADDTAPAGNAEPVVDDLSLQETIWIRPLTPMPSIPPSRNGNGNGNGTSPQPAAAEASVDLNGTNGSHQGNATDDGGSGRLPRIPGEKRRRTRPPLRGLRGADRPGDQHHPAAHPRPAKEGEKT
jgi:hypothetical protein